MHGTAIGALKKYRNNSQYTAVPSVIAYYFVRWRKKNRKKQVLGTSLAKVPYLMEVSSDDATNKLEISKDV